MRPQDNGDDRGVIVAKVIFVWTANDDWLINFAFDRDLEGALLANYTLNNHVIANCAVIICGNAFCGHSTRNLLRLK